MLFTISWWRPSKKACPRGGPSKAIDLLRHRNCVPHVQAQKWMHKNLFVQLATSDSFGCKAVTHQCVFAGACNHFHKVWRQRLA